MLGSAIATRIPGRTATADLLSGLRIACDAFVEDVSAILSKELAAQLRLATESVPGATAITDHFALRQHIAGLLEDAVALIRSCVQSDTARVMREFSKFSYLVLTGSGDIDAALRTARIAATRSINGISFTSPNARGACQASVSRADQASRHASLLAFVESRIYLMTRAGARVFVVAHADPSHRHAGIRFSLHGDDQLVSWADIRDEVFHPNSHALVTSE